MHNFINLIFDLLSPFSLSICCPGTVGLITAQSIVWSFQKLLELIILKYVKQFW